MFLKNKNIIFKIRRSKITDYAALSWCFDYGPVVEFSLTHICLASFLWNISSVELDKTPQNTASDQVLHCIRTECTYKI